MVATRNHPSDFQTPTAVTESPTKRITRASAAAATASPPSTPTRSSRPSTSTTTSAGWSHTPSNLSLLWLAVSLPLVLWDTGYVLLRPHSMPGGFLHAPIWSPYKLYGEVDGTYGFKAYDSRNGWPGTQSWFNVFETVGYLAYLYMVFVYGQPEDGRQGRGAPDRTVVPKTGGLKALAESRTVQGKVAASTVLLGYSVISLTFFKTIMYMLIEVCSGFDMTGHNSFARMIFLYYVPNGAWIVVPGYLMFVLGGEILQGLEVAATSGKKGQ